MEFRTSKNLRMPDGGTERTRSERRGREDVAVGVVRVVIWAFVGVVGV
jgi:hypothetical protein